MKRKETGITLLSLCVTLIVMIILAGIALRLSIGNDGIIGMTSNTVDQYTNATDQEQEGLNRFVDEFNSILNDRPDSGEGTGDNITIEDRPTITIAGWNTSGGIVELSTQAGYNTEYRIGRTGTWQVYDGQVNVDNGDTIYARYASDEGVSQTVSQIVEDTNGPDVTIANVTVNGSEISITVSAVDHEMGMPTPPTYNYYIKPHNETYYEYKSEIKNIETIKTGKQTYNYNFVDIDNNMPHPFTLDLSFVGEVDTEAVETLLESKGFYFDTEANKYRSPKFDRYINLENANTVEISETYVIDTLTKYLNDNSIKISYIGYGGDITGGTATCNLYKDNNYYGVICFDFNNILEIIVPDNVGNTDNAIIDYGINKIKNTLSIKDDINLNKISGYWYEINPYGSKAIVKKVEGTHIGNNIFVDNLDEGVTITVTEKQNATMENEIKNKGYTNILGSYELTLEGATKLTNPVDITFNVGTEHNGKTVYILHQKQNGTYENFEEKVVDGKVTITVSELSPFVLALKEDNTQTETPQDEQTQDTTNEHIKDDTPKTGNNDIATIVCSILSVLSAAGIAIVKKF